MKVSLVKLPNDLCNERMHEFQIEFCSVYKYKKFTLVKVNSQGGIQGTLQLVNYKL